tara:strand:+ start:2146 stop:3429 length:1284 start_codon:yes stop_codon:yes gene_type:complete
MEKCLLLHIGIGSIPQDDEIQEFRALAYSAGVVVSDEMTIKIKKPTPNLFIGTGKVKEIQENICKSSNELVLVNQTLSASQERNLEKFLGVRVLDRNGLILDIFSQRARTFEGKLQVEIAQLDHLSVRLVRGWTHLERQKGGIGLRGPGETQLETDRRLIGNRIKSLKNRLERVAKQREMSRRERRKANAITVALVGYTNVGKTTLFNALSDESNDAKDKLFATLDPTIRRFSKFNNRDVLIADTVGFVRDLPHQLIAAFKSTLTETKEASLLLHVIDSSDPHKVERSHEVEKVLTDIGAGNIPCIHIYNKCDKFSGDIISNDIKGSRLNKLWISAKTGEGIDNLIEEIKIRCFGELISGKIDLGPNQSKLRAKLFSLSAVTSEKPNNLGGWTLDLMIPNSHLEELSLETGVFENMLKKRNINNELG